VRGASGPAAQGGRKGGPPVSVKMTQCPVCGTYVVPGKAISLVSAGSPVYFDTEKCRAEFQIAMKAEEQARADIVEVGRAPVGARLLSRRTTATSACASMRRA
jgi:hypothetical protein